MLLMALRILFTISDTGGGHRAGAAAICAALTRIAGDDVQTFTVDLLASTGVPVVRSAPDLFDKLSTRWLPLFDLAYRMTDSSLSVNIIQEFVYLGSHRNLMRIFNEVRPDMVVSVHSLSNRMVTHARRTYRLSLHYVTVVTDLVSLHASWADSEVDLCIVATREAYEKQTQQGLPPARLALTGFPVHPKFTYYATDQQTTRAQLGLAVVPFTVLITSGGVGSGNMRDVVAMLIRAYPHLQLLIVTGRNTVLRDDLEALAHSAHVHIYGFVSNMEELMAASDVVVTKAGPGTLMESLVMRKPVLVTQAVGPQEQGNIEYVVNHALGMHCPTVERIVAALAELQQPHVYAETVARLVDAVPRDGAEQIARLLLQRFVHEPPHIPRRIERLAALPGVAARRLRASARLLRTVGVGRLWRRQALARRRKGRVGQNRRVRR